MTQPLFVYGSMRDGDVRALVLGCAHREVRAEPAWMRDAAVAQVPGESYPYLVSVEGARAPGEVLYGLDETGLDRIHFFEGDEYAFMGCDVELGDVERSGGGRVAAMHFGGVAIAQAPIVAWSLERWQARAKARFLSMTREYMAGWQRATRPEAEALWQRLLREPSSNGGER